MNKEEVIFLKLGGSLITDKQKPYTAQLDIIQQISQEIAHALSQKPNLNLVIGHGSGSFGHASANQYQTQEGGEGAAYWKGFAQVWHAARELNQILIDQLSSAGLGVIAFPPSSGVISAGQKIISWDVEPLRTALTHGLIPVVQGDVVFDTQLGGTILSTEHIFHYLSSQLSPQRILLAGSEAGVYLDPDQPNNTIERISPNNIEDIMPALSGANAIDVTGGMVSKVQLMYSLVIDNPLMQIEIFSGKKSGQIFKALISENVGTTISAH
jgi:isopentenyl phosphate kinase